MMTIEKDEILEELNRKLEQANIINIKKQILNEEDINYKLVDSILNQYDNKILFLEKRQLDLMTKLTKKDNTIYKNNIIIEKLNHIITEQKGKMNSVENSINELRNKNDNYRKELIDINNKYSVEMINLQHIINNKNSIIHNEKNNYTKLTISNTQLNTSIYKNNKEIFYIYIYSIYILILCQIINYINIYPWVLEVLTIISGHLFIFFKFRFNIKQVLNISKELLNKKIFKNE
jgi:hypothetical protein